MVAIFVIHQLEIDNASGFHLGRALQPCLFSRRGRRRHYQATTQYSLYIYICLILGTPIILKLIGLLFASLNTIL